MMEMMKHNNKISAHTGQLIDCQTCDGTEEHVAYGFEEKKRKTNSHRTAAKLVWTRMCHWNICCESNTGLLSITGVPIKHNNKGERHSFFWSVHQAVNCCHGGKGEKGRNPHRLFSRLLLKSLIMSDRKRRRTSIRSMLGVEFFNSVATTLRITENNQ